MRVPDRTSDGKVAKHLFLSLPLVWVEGDSDLTAYAALAEQYGFLMEPAGGREECLKLAEEMARQDHLYVVVIDGDYEVLQRSRSFHRRAVFLDRYSVENYLCEGEPVSGVVRRLAGPSASHGRVRRDLAAFIDHLETELRDLLIQDVAQVLLSDSDGPMPQRIDQLLRSPDHYRIDRSELRRLDQSAEIDGESLREASQLITDWESQGHRLIDLIRGHIVFGGLSRLISNAVARHRSSRPIISNWSLMTILAGLCWENCSEDDHRSLRRRVRDAVNEVRREADWIA